ncbi:MAG: hypothetical protein ABI190_01430 [Casimicrobiaceae bacterium]
MKKRVSRFMSGGVCPLCEGKRLKRAALSVTFAGVDIGTLAQMSLNQVAALLAPVAEGRYARSDAAEVATMTCVEGSRERARRVAAGGASHAGAPDVRRTPNMSPEKRIAAQRIARDLIARIATLQELGLGYLTLERSTPTLSSGELQRLRLATQVRSNLFGVVYVLDEPTAGLHPVDSEALMSALDALKRGGNSIFVIEHDLEMMRRAQWLVDVGPDAGERGGRILYSGPPAGLARIAASHTARYLFAAPSTATRQPRPPTGWLALAGVTRNNLHDVAVRFPLGVMTAVTGISGSGKSTLVSQALVDLVCARLGQEPQVDDDEADTLEPTLANSTAGRIEDGLRAIRRLVRVDQKPIGRTPRSNLATYTSLFDAVRKLFAATKAARARRFDAGRFSINVAKGRCPVCEGEGFVSVELLFMPSVYAPCPTCHGARYNEDTLKVTWRERNIAQVLQMSVDEALVFFAGEVPVQRPLTLLREIGLGYLRLGQPATELSGGEAQRIKLATELQRAQHGQTLYVLDEPTTGLHPADTDKLMAQLQGLVDAGNTVVVVEHEMRVVAGCDWVIDVGPGAGEEGGRIVASGTPRQVSVAPHSRTAAYLRQHLP